jgi:CBS domain-containing protein
MQARDLMTTTVVTIQPDATVGEAAQLMLKCNISCLPVVDEQDRLVGILTHTDFGLHPKYHPLAENVYSLLGVAMTPQHIEEVSRKVSSKLVKDVMRHPVITVHEDASIAEVTGLMLRQEIHRLPVLRGSQLAGIITSHDFLKLIAAGQQAGAAE